MTTTALHREASSSSGIAKRCRICLETYVNNATAEETFSTSRDISFGDVECQPTAAEKMAQRMPCVLSCGHTFCMGCLHQHMEASVEDKKIPFVCPELDCGASIPQQILSALVKPFGVDGPPWQAQYDKLITMKANPALVECTQCTGLVDSTRFEGSNDLQCHACLHSFCKEHGDIHSTMSCQVFVQSEQGKIMALSEEALRSVTKTCTRCGALLQKGTGCDFVLCGNCKGDFCYKCGTHEHIVTTERYKFCLKCNGTPHFHPHQRLNPSFVAILMCGCVWMIVVFVLLLAVWAVLLVPSIIVCGPCLIYGQRWTLKEKLLVVVYTLFWPICFIYDQWHDLHYGEFFFLDNLPWEKAREIPYLDPTTTK